MALYIRQEVAILTFTRREGYAPFVLRSFFTRQSPRAPFHGSTVTGNISVLAMLAIVTFLVVELTGIRAQGLGYLNTIFTGTRPADGGVGPDVFPHDADRARRQADKPFALMIRLFANDGRPIVVLALIGLIFALQGALI